MSEQGQYGEPWKIGNGTLCIPNVERMLACVNALAGIDNPDAWVKRAKAALAAQPTQEPKR